MVFAAASLKNALDEIAATWSKDTGKSAPKISYGASPTLAKQIEQGAPADLFISADLDWMDYVATKNLIKADTRFNLLGNKIVLIAPKASKTTTVAIIFVAVASTAIWWGRHGLLAKKPPIAATSRAIFGFAVVGAAARHIRNRWSPAAICSTRAIAS